MAQDQSRDDALQHFSKRLGAVPCYYARLDLSAAATVDQIRRAYRLKSKLYHPDTTILAPEVASQKFRELKEAYAVLSNAERRSGYDAWRNGALSSSAPAAPPTASASRFRTASAALDPRERSLSPGEIFAVFLLGITFVVCLTIAIILGVARGEMVLHV